MMARAVKGKAHRLQLHQLLASMDRNWQAQVSLLAHLPVQHRLLWSSAWQTGWSASFSRQSIDRRVWRKVVERMSRALAE
jgi:hypothetical protein